MRNFPEKKSFLWKKIFQQQQKKIRKYDPIQSWWKTYFLFIVNEQNKTKKFFRFFSFFHIERKKMMIIIIWKRKKEIPCVNKMKKRFIPLYEEMKKMVTGFTSHSSSFFKLSGTGIYLRKHTWRCHTFCFTCFIYFFGWMNLQLFDSFGSVT